MNPLSVHFMELYRRHLRRHSEFGINVLHLASVVGIYLSLLALGLMLPYASLIVGGLLVAYLLMLLPNLPVRTFAVTAAAIVALTLAASQLPAVSIWLYLLIILASHRLQIWQHRVYRRELDMSEFAGKYRKGPALAFMLALYELPLLLHYLCFDRGVTLNESTDEAMPVS
ncbi:MAG: hypothetical protein U1A77_20155 [Pirellulales bacterium]